MDWRERDALLLPDRRRWGRGYGGRPYTTAELEETRGYITEALATGQGLAGYERRGLIGESPDFQVGRSQVVLPPGFDADHPSRAEQPNKLLLQPNHPTSIVHRWRVPVALEAHYRASGVQIDQHGRWVHPLGLQVVEAGIPVCTGYGVGYEGGEVVVVDTVVDSVTHVLLTTRMDGDHKIPSLVGGYTWPTDFTSLDAWRAGVRPIDQEGIFRAVRRIVLRKAGIVLPGNAEMEITRGIRPWSSVHTLNFGTLTYTVRVRLAKGAHVNLRPEDGAFWWPKWNIDSKLSQMWPDHQRAYRASMYD